jgi:hypothetical protein
MITVAKLYEGGSITEINPVDYYLISGAFVASGNSGGVGGDTQYLEYLDPLNTSPGGGGNGNGLLANYNADDIRIVDNTFYSIYSYPYKDWGYPWAWWEKVTSDEPENTALTEFDPNFEWWDQDSSTRGLTFPKQPRPNFYSVYDNYPKMEIASGQFDDKTPAQVANEIGGQVLSEFLGSPDLNFCCIRLSMALQKAGVTIPDVPGKTWKGADGKNFIRGIDFLLRFLKETFGEPEVQLQSSDVQDNTMFMASKIGMNNKGIYVMIPKNQKTFKATGHATLWGGFNCIGGHNYFGAAGKVFVWKLPQ